MLCQLLVLFFLIHDTLISQFYYTRMIIVAVTMTTDSTCVTAQGKLWREVAPCGSDSVLGLHNSKHVNNRKHSN